MTIIDFAPTAPIAPATTAVTVPHRFDVHELDAFASTIDTAAGDVVLDLGAVQFIDTAGLHALVEARAEALGRGAELWIDGLSVAARVTFELAGLGEAFPVLDVPAEVAA